MRQNTQRPKINSFSTTNNKDMEKEIRKTTPFTVNFFLKSLVINLSKEMNNPCN